MRRLIVKDLLSELGRIGNIKTEQRSEFLKEIRPHLIGITNEFVQKNRLEESYFIRDMNKTFDTSRFKLLLKRWTLEYFLRLFDILDDFVNLKRELVLEDMPLHRFAVKKYYDKLGTIPKIKWEKSPGFLKKIVSIFLRWPIILYLSLGKGVKVFGRKKKYKVMREAVWALYDIGGYYFHDDFLVDGNKIKKDDIILYSRYAIHTDSARLKGFHDAKKSPYAHFDLLSLPLGLRSLFLRIIPKYLISATGILFREISSPHFSLYWSAYSCFIYNAMLYEKVFSSFEIVSELGHNYYSLNHIVEAIVCQNHGTRYYLMHWSDYTLPIVKYSLAFLGCDKFLSWGKAHIRGLECDQDILISTGYVFKKFIKEVSSNRDKVMSDMGIKPKGKIITFFDESFGRGSEMTEEHFIVFWKTMLKLAEQENNNTIVVKPKNSETYKLLSQKLKEEHLVILNKISKMKNIFLIDEKRWSFIEAIGISDIVVSQGMTTSGTAAIVCGIEGLYLDQFGYEHEFSRRFKDRIVFDDSEKLLDMIRRIIREEEAPSKDIPEGLLREFDKYPDDRSIDLFRDILSGSAKGGKS